MSLGKIRNVELVKIVPQEPAFNSNDAESFKSLMVLSG